MRTTLKAGTTAILARAIATTASMALLAASVYALDARSAVALQAVLASGALVGLVAESGIGVETTRLAARGYLDRDLNHLLIRRLSLLLGGISIFLLGFSLLGLSDQALLFLLVSPLAFANQVRTHRLALLRADHHGRFDLSYYPYVVAADFFAAAFAVILTKNVYFTAATLASTALITTTAFLLILRRKAPRSDLHGISSLSTDPPRPGLINMLRRGAAPMLSGAGPQVLVLALATGLTAKTSSSEEILLASIGARILAAGFPIVVLICIVPVHVQAAKAAEVTSRTKTGVSAMFLAGTIPIIAYALLEHQSIIRSLPPAIGIGLIGVGLFLVSEGIHRMHGSGNKVPIWPTLLTLSAVIAVTMGRLDLLPFAGILAVAIGLYSRWLSLRVPSRPEWRSS